MEYKHVSLVFTMYITIIFCALLGFVWGSETSCGPNEQYITCGDPCPETCDSPKPEYCIDLCLINGCVCKPGYVRESKTGPCIRKEKCRNKPKGKRCGKHEIATQCDVPCQPTCKNPNPKPCFTLLCGKPDCVCQEGFIRKDENGKCIPLEKCACGPNEVMTTSGFDCVTCENRFYVKCALNEETKCRCKEGFIRSESGSCISERECQRRSKCSAKDPKSEYRTCGSSCPRTCSEKPRICAAVCVPGCFCKQGYVLNQQTGKCVLPKKCPK